MTMFAAARLAAAPALPSAYAAAAKAKLERDRKSYQAFRKIDQDQHDLFHQQRVTSAVAAASEDLRLWHEDVEETEPQAAAALAAFRAAEDRARERREYAAQQHADYERIKDSGSAEAETEALIRSDTAENVAFDSEKAMQEKQADLTVADAALAEARDGLAAAERHLDKVHAETAGSAAGPAPISDVTIRACSGYMQSDELWDTLSRQDRSRVHFLAGPRPVMSDREWQAQLAEAFAVMNGGGS